ncbi:MAG: tyrosine-type recombinase/integrase [Caulobacteraceae bacterium]
MPRPTNRLSHRTVATLTEPGMYADGAGLYLEVDAKGKRWTFIFRLAGKRKQMGLGAVSDVSLAKARAKAVAARELVQSGKNPIGERDAERRRERALTFGEMADKVLLTVEKELSNAKHLGQWKKSLREHAAGLKDIPVTDVTTNDVLDILRPIWTEIPESASRTRARIERVLDAAKASGQRDGDNPARWKGHLAVLLPRRARAGAKHHTALPFDQVAAFITDLQKREATAARALEFTILTAARTGETCGATWGEIDFANKVWTIPADRMKAKVEHRVALSSRAIEILTAIHAGAENLGPRYTAPSAPVFLGQRLKSALSSMGMEMLLRRIGTEVTVHGFRSTFRDWAGEMTDFPREVTEAALAHAVGNAVEQAYRRGDALEKRRKLMEAWGGYCAAPQVVVTSAR